MQCVILAGGIGTRMRPLTERIPKALLEAAGQPFIDHQLQWISTHGVDEVVLCIGHLGEQLRHHVGDGAKWGIRVRYAEDGPVLRGTAGALRAARDAGMLAEEFLVTYGDSFLPIDFATVWTAFRATARPALMTVLRNDGRWDSSNVVYANGLVTLYDKHHRFQPAASFHYIDYGLSAMSRSVVEQQVRPAGVHDLADLFCELSRKGELAGYETADRFYEIGSPSGLADFERWLEGHRA
jgi:NDP-sugar pyrophosphorylase family protein